MPEPEPQDHELSRLQAALRRLTPRPANVDRDRVLFTVSFVYDAVNDESGFRIGVIPEGLGAGVSTASLEQVFGPQ